MIIWRALAETAVNIIISYSMNVEIFAGLAKHSLFQPYEGFHENTFTVAWLVASAYYLTVNIHGKTFVPLTNRESLAQLIFSCLR